jgi:hypothetical protein
MKLRNIDLMMALKTLRTVLCLVTLLSGLSFADTTEKIDFKTYTEKVATLNAACKNRGSHGFSGFCLTREYGRVTYNDPNQTSITLGLQIASLERFYSTCEHADFSSAGVLLAKAKTVLEAQKYFDEIKTQEEGLNNYQGRFHPCGSKGENDAAISKEMQWFEYMIQKYATSR